MDRRAFLGGTAAALAGWETGAVADEAKRTSPAWLAQVGRQLRQEFNLPAVWVAANLDGEVDAFVSGVRKFGDPTPATLEDKLTIASISKPMAGLWIATLVDRGKLSYEDPVLKVLPELAEICLPEHRNVTLAQLLTHTAGVIRDVKQFPNNLKLEQYPEERLKQAREVLSSPSPGTKGKEAYTNNGVTLAATMAERVAGEPYETGAGRLFRERLGLSSWGVWPMNMADDLSLPWPHRLDDGAPKPQPPSSVQFQFVRPSGGAHCTLSDLVRFGLLSLGLGPVKRNLLQPQTWQLSTGAYPGSNTTLECYATGFDRFEFGHGGSLGVTSSQLAVYPEWNAALAVHTNAGSDAFRSRGIQLLRDALRRRRAARSARPCEIALTGVATVDSTWKNEIVPTRNDPKVRIRIRFAIQASPRTGDLQTLVTLGGVDRRDERFRGLVAGDHELHFEFDTPKDGNVEVTVEIDSLRTAGNRTPRAASYRGRVALP